MVLKTLGIYLFSQYIGTFLRASLGISCLILLVDMIEFSRSNADSDSLTLGTIVLATMLRIPGFYEKAIPFLVLISSILTLVALNRKNELTIMRAAGISTWNFLTPICLGSLVIGIVAIAVLNPVSALTFSWAAEIEAGIKGEIRSSFDSNKQTWMRQNTTEGVTLIGAKSTARRGLLLNQPTFIRLDRNDAIAERFDAERAYLEPGLWRLENATRYKAGETAQVFETVNIKSALRPEFVEETLTRPEAIPVFELYPKIEIARAFGRNANSFATHFNFLIALPALLVTMTLIAATVSLRFVRSGLNLPVIYGGIIAGFALYVVTQIVKAFGNAGLMSPVLAAWLPVFLAGAFAISVLISKEDG
jgi:lipopolysaccharide export system permease protein